MFRLTRLLVLSRGLSTSAPRLEKFINRAHLMGRVDIDPKVNELKDGRSMATFRLATSHVKKITHTDGSFSKKDKVQWHNIVVYEKFLQDYVLEYVTKGSRVLLDGNVMYTGRELEDGTVKHFKNIVLRDITYM